MTPEILETVGNSVDEAFFLIAGAMLLIEIGKALFTRRWGALGPLDMIASVSTQIPYLFVEIFLMASVYALFVFVGETFVTWTFPLTLGTVLLGLLAADFVYYWEHRFAHEVRLLWTQHAVHHSSRHMNIIVGIRFGPFEGVTSAVFHFPLVLLGFPPELVFFGVLVVLAYQSWIHTELIGKLGWIDGVFNTPANHRVHHGCDDKYLDKNYGGILILWDRLFGTYQREEETPNYGLKRDFNSVNPFFVWFSELPALWRDIKQARSIHEVLGRMFGRPGASQAASAPMSAHDERSLKNQS
ncbi:MAG: sterol desaturase family protein [Pseudomonadota bacterium]